MIEPVLGHQQCALRLDVSLPSNGPLVNPRHLWLAVLTLLKGLETSC